ncbi:MAG: DNA-3-methyladenine glycosylase 2 family protein [Rubrivivax sp.]|nr:DNA-3-methyladenine glycosylase 2 family protein [Pyrinomonadaceae bacterium]
MKETRPLTEASLRRAVSQLETLDPDFAPIAGEFGTPPLFGSEPGFPALVRIMLGQQVSLASALAIYERLLAAASPLTPATLLALDDDALRRAGFSRQKVDYIRNLARSIEAGELDLGALALEVDDAVRAKLVSLKGIGPWTAEMYLLRALRRSDAFPAGDLALQIAAQEIKRLRVRPSARELEEMAERWKPLRSVAARLLWQHYLNRPRAKKI